MIPLLVDRGGWCCTELPTAIRRLGRRKVGDKMWVAVQHLERLGPFKACLEELSWSETRLKVAAKFSLDGECKVGRNIMEHITEGQEFAKRLCESFGIDPLVCFEITVTCFVSRLPTARATCYLRDAEGKVFLTADGIAQKNQAYEFVKNAFADKA